MTSTAIDVSTLSIRVVLAEPDYAPSLEEFWLRLSRLSDLLFIAALADKADIFEITHAGQPANDLPAMADLSSTARVQARITTQRIKVASLSYNSPVEIVLWGLGVGAGGGASFGVYQLVRNLLAIFDKFTESRVKHSDANVRIAENNLKQQAIGVIGETMKRTAHGIDAAREILKEEDGAASALASITRLEVTGLPPGA